MEIEDRPDGGRVFVLAAPDLSWVRIDYQTRLQFGEAELVIECPFVLRAGGMVSELDPNERGGLGPLVALYPDTLTRMTMAPNGTLEAVFASGSSLTVPPHPAYEAWNIGGFWCPPGGFSA